MPHSFQPVLQIESTSQSCNDEICISIPNAAPFILGYITVNWGDGYDQLYCLSGVCPPSLCHTYSQPGSYTIEVTYQNADCGDLTITPLQVNLSKDLFDHSVPTAQTVYSARSLATIIDLELPFDDQLLCNQQGYFKLEESIDWDQVEAAGLQNPAIPLLTPNPTGGEIMLLSGGLSELFVLYDLQGREVMRRALTPGQQQQGIMLDQVPPGMYVYRLQRGGESFFSGKLVVK